MKVFEISTPDGRVVRHRHASLEEAQKAVIAGYVVTGEVLGASADMLGGFLDPIGPGTESLMKTLLDNRGDELLAWLAKKGFIRTVAIVDGVEVADQSPKVWRINSVGDAHLVDVEHVPENGR